MKIYPIEFNIITAKEINAYTYEDKRFNVVFKDEDFAVSYNGKSYRGRPYEFEEMGFPVGEWVEKARNKEGNKARYSRCMACGRLMINAGSNIYCDSCRDRENIEDRKKILSAPGECAEELAQAVTIQAVKDYEKPIHRIDVEHFFLSDYFYQISGGVNGVYILNKLQERVKGDR